MNLLNLPRQKSSNKLSRLLILSLLGSFLLHLLVISILTLLQQPKEIEFKQQPTIVKLVELPLKTKKTQSQQPNEFEIDQQPITLAPKKTLESFRKADLDQQVEKEQAPEADDVRDQTTKQIIPPAPSHPKRPRQKRVIRQQPETQTPQRTQAKQLTEAAKKMQPVRTPQTELAQPSPAVPQLILPDILRPDFNTLDQIARGNRANNNRRKKRTDIEIGDTVWLNLQHNLLVSFFRRFHDQIELVWNYPAQALSHGIEGTLELLIIVDRDGELLDVLPTHSSGSDLLDFEAIQAVYRAAPFGALTRHYPHEKLKIRAYFSYHIDGSYIYGRQ